MNGFPTRVLRNFFGPKLTNARPIEKPDQEVGAEAMNPLLRQVAGMNLGISRVTVIANWTGSTFKIAHQSEAWNPNMDVEHPSLDRVSAGAYTLTFATTYADGEGVQVAPNLIGGRVTSIKEVTAFANRVDGDAWVDPGNASIVQIRLWNQAGTLTDSPFWLEAF